VTATVAEPDDPAESAADRIARLRRVAEGHGGRLVVDGEPGKGSVFTLVLPGACAGEEETRQAA